jgi:hypothetical protein
MQMDLFQSMAQQQGITLHRVGNNTLTNSKEYADTNQYIGIGKTAILNQLINPSLTFPIQEQIIHRFQRLSDHEIKENEIKENEIKDDEIKENEDEIKENEIKNENENESKDESKENENEDDDFVLVD